MTEQWTQPDLPFEGGLPADTVKLKDLVGCAALVAVGGCHAEVMTRFDPKPAVRVCMVVLNGPQAGTEYIDVLVFNAQPVRRLRSMAGMARVVHIDIDDPSAPNPATLVEEPSPDEHELAVKWHTEHPTRTAELVEIAVASFNANEKPSPRQQQRPATTHQRSAPPTGPSGPPPAPRTPQSDEPPF